jgi:GT2 family glycosyltransferase
MPAVSVCICTRNRPSELLTVLGSIQRSVVPVHQVVVSDDSTCGETQRHVRESAPHATYLAGPRAGLGANRNLAARAATGDLLLFLDDDCQLDEHFLSYALARLRREDHRTIVTGRETNRGRLVAPGAQTFLGYQARPYRLGEAMTSVVINSTLWPRALFDEIRFDEQLVYGYDEVDLASRATAIGYKIVPCAEAINHHTPAASNRSMYERYVEASRIYVTHKRYRLTERRRWKARAFLVSAAVHLLAACIRRNGPRGVIRAADSLRQAALYMR